MSGRVVAKDEIIFTVEFLVTGETGFCQWDALICNPVLKLPITPAVAVSILFRVFDADLHVGRIASNVRLWRREYSVIPW